MGCYVPYGNLVKLLYDQMTIVSIIGELYTVACSPTDPTLVATGGGDDKGFIWKIGQGDWAFQLQGRFLFVTKFCLS